MGLRFAIFNFSEKLQDIFEIGFKKLWSDRRKIALGEKKYFEIILHSQIRFVVYMSN